MPMNPVSINDFFNCLNLLQGVLLAGKLNNRNPKINQFFPSEISRGLFTAVWALLRDSTHCRMTMQAIHKSAAFHNDQNNRRKR